MAQSATIQSQPKKTTPPHQPRGPTSATLLPCATVRGSLVGGGPVLQALPHGCFLQRAIWSWC